MILQELNRCYNRLAGADAAGWSSEKFGWTIIIDADGAVVDVFDERDVTGKKPAPRLFAVPAAVKRTVAVAPNFLWDKSSYTLGRTAGEGRRTALEHAAFRELHLARLGGSDDLGLVALYRFLDGWTPDRFDAPPFKPEMLDANIMFRLAGDRGHLHDRPAARALIDAAGNDDDGERAADIFCLITGDRAPVARLHPTIKGVDGAQSSGAALISFNLDAFTSNGKAQGENAPTSRAAATRYGTVLNRLLTRDGPNRVRGSIGDATTVFWADASNAQPGADAVAEMLFGGVFSPPADDEEARKVRDKLDAVVSGRPTADFDPKLLDGTRFFVLGLSPNAARLSVRYWMNDDFGVFARNLARHEADMAIDPAPWRRPPAIGWLLQKTTALQEKRENVPPLLGGEMMRAVLTGGAYPRLLLAAAVIRLRAGDDPGTGWHAAAIRAVLTREFHLKLQKEDVPMSLDRDHPNEAYQLGRLFAIIEAAQRMALGRVNATVRDRYYGAASATPAGVFPLLLRGVQNHLAKLRKGGKGGWIEREIEDIVGVLPTEFTRSLPLAEQGRFAIGYYHQRKAQFAGKPDAEIDPEIETPDIDIEDAA